MKKKRLSIIIPCYNEEASVAKIYTEIDKISNYAPLDELDIQLLFINDGSMDNTLCVIKKLATENENVNYIDFSRNFGKEAAIYAGLENAKSDYYALMDADLQDPPELLKEMYEYIKNENYDCIAAKRFSRNGEPFLRSLFSKGFYKIINLISKTEIVDGARDFRLMTRQMVEAILSIKEYHRFSKGIFSWVGFKTKWIEYKNIERTVGKTKWSFGSLFLYSLDGIFSFSVAPLVFISIVGLLISSLSLVGIITIIFKKLYFGDSVAGWASMVVSIFFLGGLQLLCIGIIGQYLSKIYFEVKKRPIYIIKDSKLLQGIEWI